MCALRYENVQRKVIGTNFKGASAFWKELSPDKEKAAGNPDIIHANNFSCPMGIHRSKIVYTLHDIHFMEFPEYTTEANRLLCFDGVFRASVCADYVMSVSRYSKARFLEFFPHYPDDRIEVVPLASRFRDKPTPANPDRDVKGLMPGKFWLTVGTLEPRKNIRRILKAFREQLDSSCNRYPLVMAGGKGWLEEDLDRFIDQLGLRPKVRTLGYVSDELLAWLYANCFSFVYPSLYEGFGLPVLEAMSLGAAVITSNTTSLPEVGGDAVHYVNPLDIADIGSAFRLLENDTAYRERLRVKAVERSKGFSWEASARKVLEIYACVNAAAPRSLRQDQLVGFTI